MTGKFTDVMKAAKDENQTPSQDEGQKTSSEVTIVNVCIKVPLTTRKRWAIAATTREVSLKDLIVEAVEQHLAET